MKSFSFLIKNKINKLHILLYSIPFLTTNAFAIDKTDLTQDMSGGKDIGQVFTNMDNIGKQFVTLLLGLCVIVGACLVGISLTTLYKAAKDEREKPMSAIVGLIVGGLFTAIPVILWISSNSLLK
ncbi:hypothetical protein ACQIBV_003758 [Yersinia enterocolitica]|uniref:hypothetical protein n=1 Tax=Yersinia TaxID=629 RepID=UPI0005DC33DA|nr:MULTISPECIES: hypothetical protein [Yersinia]EKN3395576.1 hypothetical protein [Yersinia enterocolitica]EKN3501139.1 hypothetical protein [Yersinia enterocolitica]EKN3636591.1 hypothetical protein [Yersinia enterocolitica]EKN3687153.1 hypothetical protein [Yersinia enterocolitica]EKN3832487.1 hypothetical protein [Yersinia enterocolitica]